MPKFLSDPEIVTRACDDAIASVYPDFVQTLPGSFNGRSLLRKPLCPGRVNIIVSTGGGGGPFSTALPFGSALADICVNGGMYAAPSAYDIYEAARFVGSRSGYLLVYNNFMGDCLNNDLALELMELDQLPGTLMPFWDDCLSVPPEAPREERTGLQGMLYGIRIAADAAAKGASLQETAAVCERVRSRVSSLTVTFDSEKGLVQLGEGISGEPARIVCSDEFSLQKGAALACDYLLKDLAPAPDEKIYLLVNRMFPTNYEDMYIFAGELKKRAEMTAPVPSMSVGHFMRMSYSYGFSVTMLCADDSLAAPLSTRCFTDSFIL